MKRCATYGDAGGAPSFYLPEKRTRTDIRAYGRRRTRYCLSMRFEPVAKGMQREMEEQIHKLGLHGVHDLSSSLGRVSKGTTLFRAGDECHRYPIVLAGSVRVYRAGQWGQDIVFYRVQAGEGCTLSANCLLEGQRYPVFGIADSDTDALLLPASVFREQLDVNTAFRAFVFHQYAVRIESMVARIESLLGERPGSRLAKYLLSRSQQGVVAMTHAELAADIGTAREVVSRHLGTLARAGSIRQRRHAVEIVDVAALRVAANEE